MSNIKTESFEKARDYDGYPEWGQALAIIAIAEAINNLAKVLESKKGNAGDVV